MSVDLAKLEQHLATRSYVEGWVTIGGVRISSVNLDRYTPSQADVAVFKAISSAPDSSSNPHVTRWYNHIKSYAAEHESLPGSSTAGESFIGSSVATPAAEEDEEIDLFGSDEEEDAEAERIKAQRVAEYVKKKSEKPKTIAKVWRYILSPCRFTIYTLVYRYDGCETLGRWNRYGRFGGCGSLYPTRWSCLGC